MQGLILYHSFLTVCRSCFLIGQSRDLLTVGVLKENRIRRYIADADPSNTSWILSSDLQITSGHTYKKKIFRLPFMVFSLADSFGFDY